MISHVRVGQAVVYTGKKGHFGDVPPDLAPGAKGVVRSLNHGTHHESFVALVEWHGWVEGHDGDYPDHPMDCIESGWWCTAEQLALAKCPRQERIRR